MRFTTAALTALSAVGLASAIDIIEIQDRHFINSKTSKPFFMKGVDYQPGGASNVDKGKDPLSDPDICARDIYLFQKLGINTIRVYSVDPSLDHNECMTMLAAAGIYLVLDVNSPLEFQHLNREEPWTTYTPMYLEHIFSVIEVFSGYDNMLAFLAGNEVIFDEKSAQASPNYVKAVVRDMKAYITNHVSRIIPVGYSNADDLKFRKSLAAYLECGDTGYIDFFGVNSYQWCGDNTFEGSGYDILVKDYTDYTIPVFFTEYGCNEVRPRKWQEVDALYSEKMTGVFSGGLVYEFTQEPNDYGIVKVATNGGVSLMKEYDSLAKAFNAVPKDPKVPDMETKNRPVDCPATDTFKNIKGNLTLPFTLGADLIKNGVSDKKIVRGKFLTSALTMKSTLEIKDSNGSTVSDKTIKATDSIKQSAQSSTGHGVNTGGGVGTGGVTSKSTSNTSVEQNVSAAASNGNGIFGWSFGVAAACAAFFL